METMTNAETIVSLAKGDWSKAIEMSDESMGTRVEQDWEEGTTLFIFQDDSKLLFTSNYFEIINE